MFVSSIQLQMSFDDTYDPFHRWPHRRTTRHALIGQFKSIPNVHMHLPIAWIPSQHHDLGRRLFGVLEDVAIRRLRHQWHYGVHRFGLQQFLGQWIQEAIDEHESTGVGVLANKAADGDHLFPRDSTQHDDGLFVRLGQGVGLDGLQDVLDHVGALGDGLFSEETGETVAGIGRSRCRYSFVAVTGVTAICVPSCHQLLSECIRFRCIRDDVFIALWLVIFFVL
mmetsp:Transcript_4172/g.10855  ORF Transcript_4172/g.10855 Transcript_4172/m.10855 type:complete len:224 (-) Transcript_4172:921-1592(-)